MVSAGMVLGRSIAVVSGGQVVELWYMVSAGMVLGRSMAAVAGGQVVELRYMVSAGMVLGRSIKVAKQIRRALKIAEEVASVKTF